MQIIDISGPIEDGMWSYGDPYPAPQIEQIPPPDWLDYPVSVDPNLAFLAIFSRDCRDFGVIYSDFGYRKQPISYLKIAQI
ncbi:hypothetical protein KFU94_02690 [Chloroflexi bacterium TSY]|nr:hypothetical protein [Chloroflexi bacterium TSY]